MARSPSMTGSPASAAPQAGLVGSLSDDPDWLRMRATNCHQVDPEVGIRHRGQCHSAQNLEEMAISSKSASPGGPNRIM